MKLDEFKIRIFTFLKDHNPSESNVELHNIATGVTGVASANPHKAVEVGEAILNTMEGQNGFHCSFRKNNQLETLGIKVTPPSGDLVSVDPQLLFPGLLIISHELSTYPPALFNKNGMILKTNKPQLSVAFARIMATGELLVEPPDKAEFCILDGGSLLHRISWEKG